MQRDHFSSQVGCMTPSPHLVPRHGRICRSFHEGKRERKRRNFIRLHALAFEHMGESSVWKMCMHGQGMSHNMPENLPDDGTEHYNKPKLTIALIWGLSSWYLYIWLQPNRTGNYSSAKEIIYIMYYKNLIHHHYFTNISSRTLHVSHSLSLQGVGGQMLLWGECLGVQSYR